MKFKSDFVTNSSSSSFIIDKIHLSPIQIYLIENHAKIAPEIEEYYFRNDDAWRITSNHNKIEGYTDMDNFDMEHYLSSIGVPMHFVEWD